MPRRWLSPDFFSDEKMKKATVPERLLAAAIIANQDDDGRLRSDPAYLRSIAFLYDDYSLDDVKTMRDHLASVNPNILVYQNDDEDYIQLKRYRRYQKPRYYHPSKYPAPEGWPFEEQQPSSNHAVTSQQPSSNHADTTGEGEGKGKNLNKDLDKGEGEGRQIPQPAPAPSSFCKDRNKISSQFIDNFRHWFGRVEAQNPQKVIPREPTGKELAQMRDLAEELIAGGGCPIEFIGQAFKEAGAQDAKSKKSISYVRAVLLEWLGRPKNRSP